MNKGKTQEELSYGNEMFQKGYKAGFDRGKFKARKEFLEIYSKLLIWNKTNFRNTETRVEVMRIIMNEFKQKIKELQNLGAKKNERKK